MFSPEAIRAQGLSAPDAVLLAQECLRQRAFRGAALLCEEWRALYGRNPPLEACHAAALFGLGEQARALESIDEALELEPEHLVGTFYKAQMLLAGNGSEETRERAMALLSGLVGREPEFPGALGLLSRALFPGPAYREVLAAVHGWLRPETYLEIGVETGASLALAKTAKIAVGVDPEPRIDTPLPASARVVSKSSDDFFLRESRRSVFGELGLDLVFIDGLHWFEQALRDFCHVERWSHPGTIVIFHDCLPPNGRVTTRERSTTFWTGDTWKVVPVLREHRPDLELSIIPTPPSGLLVVRGLNSGATQLSEQLPALTSLWRDTVYPYQAGRWPKELPLVSNDERGIRRALFGEGASTS